VEVARVGLTEALEIGGVDVFLVRNAAPVDALQEHVDGRLQEHHEVRRRRVHRQARIDLVVEFELLVVQHDAREQPVLVEHVVGDADLREQVVLAQLRELARALEQEVELGRECGGTAVLVEPLEEGIVHRLLEHGPGADGIGELAREARLADADQAFDDHQPVRPGFVSFLSRHRIPVPRAARFPQAKRPHAAG
jgi:hypothetical protein